ncbi:MAG: D-glycero-beta-D-manno-heptose-7-phosphate kinase [Caedimonas sp.]|nr:D-glycero-beta-D-manno-heptose-7-phosphate kinase [Caedimonas sp.]
MQSLESLLERIPHASLLCIGDVMLDYFVYGNVDRISPEAPVPVFHKAQQIRVLGGSGNVVRNLDRLTAKTVFLSVVGHDQEGEIIERLLLDLPETKSFILKDPSRTTTTKTRYIAHHQQLLRTDHETTHPLSSEIKDNLSELFKKALDEIDVIILSDYGKGIFDHDLTRAFIKEAQTHHKPVIIDPKGHDYTLYQGATILTPNLKELSQACGKDLKTNDDIVQAARDLLQNCQIEMMLVTRSEQGMTLVDRHGMAEHIPTQALDVFDVSGAGDTVIALFSAAYAAKIPALQAARLANTAAGIVVGKAGTATTSLKEIREKLSLHSHHETFEKIQFLSDAVEQVITWKRRGAKVGFTNGCFDLLHPGHISLLTQAKAACDRLVVGLNSDQSIKRLKGLGRPVQNQEARSIVLASLESVDMIVIFEEDTPLSLIQQLRPDILVKGADYTLEEVVGAQEVTSWGGQVILAKLVPEQSTTRTIQRMK